jgi:hypothetical protein
MRSADEGEHDALLMNFSLTKRGLVIIDCGTGCIELPGSGITAWHGVYENGV